MLQQTQVDRVVPRWHAWLERWPTPQALAHSSVADALLMWDRLGYPRRARWLWQCATIISEQYDGIVPEDEDALRALPGIGTYTAAAIRAFAYRRRAVVLDTNVRRVIARHWLGQDRPTPQPTSTERAFAASLWPANEPRAAQWSAAVMELGALICTARDPRCAQCPIAGTCAWRAAGYPHTATPRRTQAPYQGSDRQARGAILGALRQADRSLAQLAVVLPDTVRLRRILDGLTADGLIEKHRGRYRLGSTSN